MYNIPMKTRKSYRLELDYIYGGIAGYGPGERLSRRTLHDWEMVLILEGQVIYHANGIDYQAPPGSLILARPGFDEAYRWDPRSHTRHAYFHFNVKSRPNDWPETHDWPIIRTDVNEVVITLYRRVMKLIRQHPDWPDVSPGVHDCRLVETLISEYLIGEDQKVDSTRHDRPEPVERAIRLMNKALVQQPPAELSLEELAAHAGVTAKHLCRLFGRHVGHSPVSTYRRLKLQTAVPYLARSNLSIKQIAHRCGYDDPLYFSRCFSRVYGQSPRTMRRRLQAGDLPPHGLMTIRPDPDPGIGLVPAEIPMP